MTNSILSMLSDTIAQGKHSPKLLFAVNFLVLLLDFLHHGSSKGSGYLGSFNPNTGGIASMVVPLPNWVGFAEEISGDGRNQAQNPKPTNQISDFNE